MPRTKSRVLRPPTKETESKDNPQPEKWLHFTNNTTKDKTKITKKRTDKTKFTQAQFGKINSENTNINELKPVSPSPSPLKSEATAPATGSTAIVTQPQPPASASASAGTASFRIYPRLSPRINSKKPMVTNEQIENLIGYIVNDLMSVKAAARQVKMSYPTAYTYYQEYENDPKHKIPLAKTSLNVRLARVTQKKIEDLIKFIVHDKMTLTQAAYKAKIRRMTAARYYAKYLEDPDRKTPALYISGGRISRSYTQEQVSHLISHIVNDKMSVAAASKKVDMSIDPAKRYYLKYLEDPSHEIPKPEKLSHRGGKSCTNDEVKTLVACIVDKGMTLREASVKANMSKTAARKYYGQYLEDPDHRIPTPENDACDDSCKMPTLDHVRNFFTYIIIDKMSIRQAAHKANVSVSFGYRCYEKYLKDPTKEVKIMDTSYSPEKMKKMVDYIQKDKMSMTSAAEKVNLSYSTARNYYREYLKDPKLGIPTMKEKQYTPEDIEKLIDYIENVNMSISAAARKIKMTNTVARTYYNAYLDDPEHKIPVPSIRGHKIRRRIIDKYSEIIADIYKKNPSIKPMPHNLHSN